MLQLDLHSSDSLLMSDLQRDPLPTRHRRPANRPRCIADLGASVSDEFSPPEVSPTANHTEAISDNRPVQHPRACIGGG